MNNQPLVSIVIPTYKRPDTLDRAIKSVLNQTYQNIEVIVVDDNNPDTEGRTLTIEKMKEFEDNPQVHYIQHEHNKNGSAARNTGARSSKGEYVAFLDDDDEYTPKRIESLLKRFSELPAEYGVCYSRYISRMPNGKDVISKENREGDLFLVALMKELTFGSGSNNLVKRDAYEAIGGYDETFKRNQDHEFMIRLLQRYKIAYCDELGLIIHVHMEKRNISIEEILQHYVESFKPIVDTLPIDVQHTFYKKVNVNYFIHYFRTEHDFKKAFSLISQGKINIIDAALALWRGGIRMLKRAI